MKRLSWLLGIFWLCTLSVSGQNNYITLEQFQGAKITGIKASMIDIEIRQGPDTGVRLEMEEYLKPHVYCRMNYDGVLSVGVESRTKKNAKAIITLSSLDLLRVTNRSKVSTVGNFTAKDTCNVLVDKGGELYDLNIQADSVRVKSTSSGKVTNLRATARHGMLIHASGGGSITCSGVYKASYCEVWSNNGRIKDLHLQVDTAAVNSFSRGEITGFQASAVRGLLLRISGYASIVCNGLSTANYFEARADNGAKVFDLNVAARSARLQSTRYSSIEIQKMDVKTKVYTDVATYSRIIGGGLDVVDKGGYKSAPDGAPWWQGNRRISQFGNNATKIVKISRFENQRILGLKCEGLVDVTLRQGSQTGMQIEIDERLMPYLTCDMEKGQIVKIGLKNLPEELTSNHKNILNRAKVTIVVSRLDCLIVNGMSKLRSEGELSADKRSLLRVDGMSTVENLNLKAASIDLYCSGMSKAEVLRFTAGEIALDVSGMSKISDCTVASQTLNLKASGMSKITVQGKTVSFKGSSAEGMSKIDTSALQVSGR